jgi:hypothetical protein
MAVELGFRETSASELASATKNATNFDTDNPGTQIFTWETLTDVDPGAGTNMRPVGLQTNLATDEVFAALGSIDFADATAKQVLTIVTDGPTASSLTTSVQLLGKYGTGGVNGRVAEITGGSALNYSNFAGTATRTVVGGDATVDGDVDFDDVLVMSPNFNGTTTAGWAGADFTGDGNVNFDDVLVMSPNFGQTGTGTNTPIDIDGVAGGAGAVAAPEPSSVMMIVLGSLLVALARRR